MQKSRMQATQPPLQIFTLVNTSDVLPVLCIRIRMI
jgi:hypothetical protein